MNCIIVDDEFPSREELKYFINNFSGIEIENEFENAVDALKYISSNKIDSIFLDINMPMLDGIEFSKILSDSSNSECKIIFVTAYKEHAYDAFQVHAFDYILKPFSKERIISALKRLEECSEINNNEVLSMHEINSGKISAMRNDKIYIINISDIYYVEAYGRGVNIYTIKSEYFSKDKISDIDKKLDKNEFFKVHRSYIVNLKKIDQVEPWYNGTYILKLKDLKCEIPVSRGNVKIFKEILDIK